EVRDPWIPLYRFGMNFRPLRMGILTLFGLGLFPRGCFGLARTPQFRPGSRHSSWPFSLLLTGYFQAVFCLLVTWVLIVVWLALIAILVLLLYILYITCIFRI